MNAKTYLLIAFGLIVIATLLWQLNKKKVIHNTTLDRLDKIASIVSMIGAILTIVLAGIELRNSSALPEPFHPVNGITNTASGTDTVNTDPSNHTTIVSNTNGNNAVVSSIGGSVTIIQQDPIQYLTPTPTKLPPQPTIQQVILGKKAENYIFEITAHNSSSNDSLVKNVYITKTRIYNGPCCCGETAEYKLESNATIVGKDNKSLDLILNAVQKSGNLSGYTFQAHSKVTEECGLGQITIELNTSFLLSANSYTPFYIIIPKKFSLVDKSERGGVHDFEPSKPTPAPINSPLKITVLSMPTRQLVPLLGPYYEIEFFDFSNAFESINEFELDQILAQPDANEIFTFIRIDIRTDIFSQLVSYFLISDLKPRSP